MTVHTTLGGLLVLLVLAPAMAAAEDPPAGSSGLTFVPLVDTSEPGRNWLAQSDFEVDLAGGAGFPTPWYGRIFKGNIDVPMRFDDQVAAFGRRSARVEVDSTEPVHLREDMYWVTPGQSYTFSAYVKAEAVEAVHVRLSTFTYERGNEQWHTEWAEARSDDITGEQFEQEGEFIRLSCTVTAGEHVYRIQPAITITGDNGKVWVDGCQLEEGSTPTRFQPSRREAQYKQLLERHAPQTWDDNAGLSPLWAPVFAFDGRLTTYWTSNEPDLSLPKDLGVHFPQARRVRAVRVVFLNDQQRPTLVGGRWQAWREDEWHDLPSRIVEAGATLTYDFGEAVTAERLRLMMDEVVGEAGTFQGRPSIREIRFAFDPASDSRDRR